MQKTKINDLIDRCLKNFPRFFTFACVITACGLFSLLVGRDAFCSPYAILRKGYWYALAIESFGCLYSPKEIIILPWNLFILYRVLEKQPGSRHISKKRELSAGVGSQDSWAYLLLTLALIFLHSCYRVLFGIAFFRWTGFAFPRAFYHDSFFEAGSLAWPLCLMLATSQTIALDELSYIDVFPVEIARWQFITTLFISLNWVFTQSFYWTCLSSLASSATLITVLSIYQIVRSNFHKSEKHISLHRLVDEREFKYLDRKRLYRRRQNPARALILHWTAQLLILFMIFIYATILRSFVNNFTQVEVYRDKVRMLYPTNRNLLTTVIMTAPRRGNPNYLTETIESYILQWPSEYENSALFQRFDLVVFTSAANGTHPAYDEALQLYSLRDSRVRFHRYKNSNKHTFPVEEYLYGTKYLDAHHENLVKQRIDFSRGLEVALQLNNPAFVMIAEDDMPLCDDAMKVIELIFQKALSFDMLGHACGAFIGTGGSGLIFSQNVAKRAIEALRSSFFPGRPVDIILQQCLRGHLPECAICAATGHQMVITSTLMMRHIGFNRSSFPMHSYNEDSFQCGWRHPFNGASGIKVLRPQYDGFDGL